MGFTHEEDARRVMAVLPKRFGKYGLAIHPDKTRFVPFRRPPHNPPPDGAVARPGTSTCWASRTSGPVPGRRLGGEAEDVLARFTRAVRKITVWCKAHRHRPLAEQPATLSQKLRGHYAYYGITGNKVSLWRFYEAVQHVWRKWQMRRKQGGRRPWSWFNRLHRRYRLPYAVAVHSILRPRGKGVT
jgi:hypothetical protein